MTKLQQWQSEPRLASQYFCQPFFDLLKVADELFNSTKEKCISKGYEDLKRQTKDLQSLAGGNPDGSLWLSGFKGTTLEQLMEHSGKTLDKMDPKHLVSTIDALTKALV